MLNIGRIWSRDCQYVTRRSLLQIGACSALGLSLPSWLAARARGATTAGRAKSVILLWLWGGPSHHETWDPKPDANSKIRGPFGTVPTRTPGLHISELLPMSAAMSDRYAVIRSMAHDQKDHNVAGTVSLTGNVAGAKASGGVPFPGSVRPSMGSLVAWMHGRSGYPGEPAASARKRSAAGQWPAFMAIGPMSKVSGEFVRGQTAGILGAARDPFRLEGDALGDGFKLPAGFSLPAEVNVQRLDNRKQLLASLDTIQRRFDAAASGAQPDDVRRLDEFQTQAMSMLTSPEAKRALDLTSEPANVRDRYGRTQFGQSCILARRLVEADVPFVQVNWSGDAEDEQQGGDGGWDLHYRLFERMQERYCPIFDRALTALLDDLAARGRLDSTLVLAMGEFGRSPQISSLGGREHWPFGYSILLAGGGIRGGQVYGSSDRDGGAPKDRPVHPANIIATVLESLGLNRIALTEMGVGIDAEPVYDLS